MANWATTIVPVIVTVISIAAPIIAGLSNYFYNQFIKPNINIEIEPNSTDNKQVIIKVENSGTISATNVSLVIIAQKIVKRYIIF